MAAALEPWRAQITDAFDSVVAGLMERDRQIEDFVSDPSVGILRVTGTTTNPGSARFWTGIEIANPTSNPFIDFHRSADPEETTDFNVRLINSEAALLNLEGGVFKVGTPTATINQWTGASVLGQGFLEMFAPASNGPFIDFHHNASQGDYDIRLHATTADMMEVLGGNLQINSVAGIGSSPFYGTNYAWFGHKDMGGSGQYCLMQDNTGSTLINAASGKDIVMRIANGSTRLSVDANGLYFYNIVGPAGTAIGLTTNKVVLQSSSAQFKRDIQPLERQGDESVLDAFWRLRPVRFLWDEDATRMDREAAIRVNEANPQGFPGLIAEEVAQEIPEAVHHDADGNVESFDTNVMIGLVIAACRQLRRNTIRLSARVTALEAPRA